MSNSGSVNNIKIRVLAASTGVCYPISLHADELNVSNIRRHLAGAVPIQDQILLLGPPYKVPKDSTLRSEEVLDALRLGDVEDDPNYHVSHKKEQTSAFSEGNSNQKSSLEKESNNIGINDEDKRKHILSITEKTGSKRLFLFSKQALSDSAPDPESCTLQPMQLNLPTQPDPSPISFQNNNSGISSSPLHQALEVYERRFMLHLCRGRALADGADMRLLSCKKCVSEQAVMAQALRAAVSNLSDHRNGAARTRTEFTDTFQTKTSKHSSLLHDFEGLLSRLADIPLHPAIVANARANGRIMETLLDTVPVERERAWANQCLTSHQRITSLFAELDTAFSQLGTPATREEEAKEDRLAEEEIVNLWNDVEGVATFIRNGQSERLGTLTDDHKEVVRVVLNAIAVGDENEPTKSDSGDAQAAFSALETMSKASVNILPSMEADDEKLKEIMVQIANAKTNAMKRMKARLRQVSITQSAIQRVLTSVNVLRDALSQQCDNMSHLDHVAELPSAYKDFLVEIRRRRTYGEAVLSTSNAMMDRLALMRSDEVKAREKFLRGSGRHLMPAFFEIFVPTLASPPPLFTPQLPAMVEMDTLPNIESETKAMARNETGNDVSTPKEMAVPDDKTPVHHNVATDAPGASDASSLTESLPTNRDESNSAVEDTNDKQMLSGSKQSIENKEQCSSASADENSGNDHIETVRHDAGRTDGKVNEKLEALANENTLLRKVIEKLGGKSPESYLEEDGSMEKYRGGNTDDGTALKELQSKLKDTNNELTDMKAKSEQYSSALAEIKKDKESGEICDKISHSSFKVGDVGLFMPTGRKSGGKRTYLAFHSNCPHRYLSTDSIDGSPDYVLGRIVYQEELIAGANGTDANPHGLHSGTKFWILTVEVLKIP